MAGCTNLAPILLTFSHSNGLLSSRTADGEREREREKYSHCQGEVTFLMFVAELVCWEPGRYKNYAELQLASETLIG